jgi:sugar phosphate isomerase/epimerase
MPALTPPISQAYQPVAKIAFRTLVAVTMVGPMMSSSPLYPLERLSFNEICTKGWSSIETIEQCYDQSIRWVGLWRDRVEDAGLANVRAALDRTGAKVSSLCRGGMFTGETTAERDRATSDNLRAIDEAATLGADVLVLVCGPMIERNANESRRQVIEGLERVIPHAAACGVRLGIEPLHPMLIASRSVVVTMREALDILQDLPADVVGMVFDAYHLFWDTDVEHLSKGNASRIYSFQISDWVLPIEGELSSRGLPGDGNIDLQGIGQLMADIQYEGPIELEILSSTLWAMPPTDAFRLALNSYRALQV